MYYVLRFFAVFIPRPYTSITLKKRQQNSDLSNTETISNAIRDHQMYFTAHQTDTNIMTQFTIDMFKQMHSENYGQLIHDPSHCSH